LGFELIPLLVGLLIVSEAFTQIERMKVEARQKGSNHSKKGYINQTKKDSDPSNHRVSSVEFKYCLPAIFGGVGIGSAMGIIPGIGTTVASYLSYTYTKKSSKNPECFGKGALKGVAAAETGNNAVSGPNLIPWKCTYRGDGKSA